MMSRNLPATAKRMSMSVMLLFALSQQGIESAAAPPLRLRSKDAAKRVPVAADDDQTGYFFFAEELDPNWVPDDPAEVRKKLETFNDDYDAMLKDRLQQDGSMHMDQRPLRDFFSAVARETRIGIYVDPNVLEEVGLDIDGSVLTINVDGVRWKSILNLGLEPLNLECILEDQILLIRRKQELAPRPRIRREYPIGDIAWRYENGSREFDPNGILREIWRSVSLDDVEYGAIVSGPPATGPTFSTSNQKKGSVVFHLSPQGHEALATGLAKFRALKRSLPDSDDIDFPNLLRVQRWKEGYFPRERFRSETRVLLVGSIDATERRRLSKDWPSIAVFGDRESAMEHVRALSEKQLRGGILILESVRQTRMKSDEPAGESPLQDVLTGYCRKRNIDLFEQVTVIDRSFERDKRYRRLFKSTESAYPDVP